MSRQSCSHREIASIGRKGNGQTRTDCHPATLTDCYLRLLQTKKSGAFTPLFSKSFTTSVVLLLQRSMPLLEVRCLGLKEIVRGIFDIDAGDLVAFLDLFHDILALRDFTKDGVL